MHFIFYQEIICFLLDAKYFPTNLYVVFFYDYFKFFSNTGFTFFLIPNFLYFCLILVILVTNNILPSY